MVKERRRSYSCRKSVWGGREQWIDICKGIGIILVLLAHAITKETTLWKFINQFHMPLFFALSGYLYNCKDTFIIFVYKKVKGLYLPYICSSVLMYMLYVLVGKETFSFVEIIKILMMITEGPLLGAIWFLRVLFWAIIIFDILNRFWGNKKKVIYIISLIMMLIGVQITFPYRFSNILVALGFISIGKILKDIEIEKNIIKWLWVPCFAIIFVASLFTKASVSTNTYTMPLLFILIAFVGIIGSISLSKDTLKIEINIINRLFCWLGRNTIGIVIWQFVAFKVVSAFQIVVYNLDYSRIWDFPVIYDYSIYGWVFCNIVVGILGSVGIYYVQQKLQEKIISACCHMNKNK